MRITAVEPILLAGRPDLPRQQPAAPRRPTTATGSCWSGSAPTRVSPAGPTWRRWGRRPSRSSPGQGMAILGFKTLGELLVGEDPLDTDRLWDKLYVGSAYYGRRGIAMQCISAIDNCLWSIRAQAAGMPLATLLGGRRRDRVMAYASTLFRETPEAMAEAARPMSTRGFRAVKFGWGVFGEDPGRDRELVAAAREALGPDRHLLVDPGWYRRRAGSPGRGAASAARPSRCASGSPNTTSDGSRTSSTRSTSTSTPPCAPPAPCPWRPASRSPRTGSSSASSVTAASTSIQPDLSRCGGLTVARRSRRWPRPPNIDVVPHSWLTHLLTGYSLQLHRHPAPRALRRVQREPECADPGHRACRHDARHGRHGRGARGAGTGRRGGRRFVAAHRVAPMRDTDMNRRIVPPAALDLVSPGRRDYWVCARARLDLGQPPGAAHGDGRPAGEGRRGARGLRRQPRQRVRGTDRDAST